jgi:hypothetical protein
MKDTTARPRKETVGGVAECAKQPNRDVAEGGWQVLGSRPYGRSSRKQSHRKREVYISRDLKNEQGREVLMRISTCKCRVRFCLVTGAGNKQEEGPGILYRTAKDHSSNELRAQKEDVCRVKKNAPHRASGTASGTKCAGKKHTGAWFDALATRGQW